VGRPSSAGPRHKPSAERSAVAAASPSPRRSAVLPSTAPFELPDLHGVGWCRQCVARSLPAHMLPADGLSEPGYLVLQGLQCVVWFGVAPESIDEPVNRQQSPALSAGIATSACCLGPESRVRRRASLTSNGPSSPILTEGLLRSGSVLTRLRHPATGVKSQ
jgi:hypothetical protein